MEVNVNLNIKEYIMKKITLLFLIFNLIYLNNAISNNQIQAVGSSTVYPFATIIAENFKNNNPQFLPPVIESIGTGAGLKFFCSELYGNGPDIANASRKIKDSEVALCNKNGIKNIIEINIGYDAIAIVSPNTIGKINLTIDDLYLALGALIPDSNGNLIANPYTTWNQINSKLPNMPIKVMGPPSTSGTRDSFIELVMLKACEDFIHNKKLIKNEDTLKKCALIRSDGAWINGGENDILLIKKVAGSKDTLAILGYSFYEQNKSKVNAVSINSLTPSKETLNNKSYPLFRPLFIYVKGEHLAFKEGLVEFVKEIISEKTISQNGYLSKAGLVSISKEEYNTMTKNVLANLTKK
jgi:phosphate transport system substrate-binding protein